ncbi:death-on-curing family protein [Cylindrospermum stagnale PCC 7417]|uniref:Death-on-curing family protein n=1 Tax=Cylindrospermum stagnale PCC 7417 TaxID=56107 RepID=K9X378_9NOST|nr:type II toxin-antitoxin system death-on-curing family toxin [Cylindrospermum stagnale]AFZ26147.1 death-on-curing family protein [Cylindrospermum stagnale PCC 7417]
MQNPKFVEKEDVLSIHDKQLRLYGGLPGIRDEGSLESAISAPQATFGGEFLYPTIVEQAATYLFNINKNHAFIDGNKRVSFAVMVTFLNMNDYKINKEGKEAEELTIQVADNKVNKQELIEILKDCITELF